MLIEYKIEGADVTRIILPAGEGVSIEDALDILETDKEKVKVTLVGMS